MALLIITAYIQPLKASAADTKPFDSNLQSGGYLSCIAKSGVRFCQGGAASTLAADQRVKSWDGQPLDADLTLPAAGDGPFPLIVMLHGYGGSKRDFESSDAGQDHGLNNIALAKKGYAVLNYTARGFIDSCGPENASKLYGTGFGALNCPTTSWMHLADSRYEARDTQYLAALLADQKIIQPGIGVIGESYGGGQSLILAKLKDRIMLQNGTLQQWRSPKGKKMRIAAASAIVPWSDLADALMPNGRALDRHYGSSVPGPFGVEKKVWVDVLYAAGKVAGNYSPQGADPSSDLTTWYSFASQGEPYDPASSASIARELRLYHSSLAIPGKPAPTFIASGWSDELFPPIHAIRFYNAAKKKYPKAKLAIDLADVGHSRAQSKGNDRKAVVRDALKWLNSYVKDRAPGNKVIRAWTQTCPQSTPSKGPYIAANWDKLARGSVTFKSKVRQIVAASGGVPDLGDQLSPVPINAAAHTCLKLTTRQRGKVAQYELPAARRGYTLLGLPTVTAKIKTKKGQLPGVLALRLWDVGPAGRSQVLVTRGIYRLSPNQSGTMRTQLFGNGWHFARGHRPKLEIVGRDSPTFRPSNNTGFETKIKSLDLLLPIREAVGYSYTIM